MVLHRSPSTPASPRTSLGQALVETAIMLPILLILLLGAIDFGRAFFGWVNLHQAVRNGANYASITPNMDADDRARYVELIESDLSTINCEPEDPIPNPIYTTSTGTPTPTPVLGDYANLTLQCDFSPLTPLMDLIVGEPLEMRASATFVVRLGCINCPTPVPASPPPPPIQCFEVPAMLDLSVAGARAAWTASGFDPAKFTPASGSDDTATVESFLVTEDDPLSNCNYPTFAIFSSSVAVTPRDDAAPCGSGEEVAPNLTGMTLGSGRDAWQAAGFDAANFQADGGDPSALDQSRVITSQTTSPPSVAGVECAAVAGTTIDVLTGTPYPAPPPSPCRVPDMIQLTRPQGESAWVGARFSASNFDPRSGGFTIRSQTLVGGTYVSCGASVRVSASP